MMPSALRSSGTMPTPARMAAAGDQRRSARPSDADRPGVDRVARRRPPSPSRCGPEPSSPARPTTSPACTSTLTSSSSGRRVSPSARSTGAPVASRCSSPKVVAPCRADLVDVAAEHGGHQPQPGRARRPAPVCTSRPSRSTVTRSQIRNTSSSLCVTYRTATCWLAQQVDHAEQQVDLARLQRRGRLVHDDDPGVGGQRPGDRDHLLHAEAELAEPAPDVDVDAVAGQRSRARLAVHPAEVDEAEPVERLPAEEQVAGDAEQRHQVDLLVDGADPGGLRVARAGEGDRLAAGSAPRPRPAGARR